MKKSTPLWCEDCRFVCFETGLGKPMLTLNDPNGFKNTTNVYSIHLELRMALPCQISTGKWKYVNLCLDFLGIPDQRTAYVKRQARPRWTYVRRSSVTPDLIIWTHDGLSSIGSLETNFSEIWIKIHQFSYKKIYFNLRFAILNELYTNFHTRQMIWKCCLQTHLTTLSRPLSTATWSGVAWRLLMALIPAPRLYKFRAKSKSPHEAAQNKAVPPIRSSLSSTCL